MQQTDENRLFYEQYIDVGMYAQQIQRYLDKFGSDKVLIFLYDDLAHDPQSILRSVFEHLGVDPEVPIDTKVYNAFSMPRSGLIRSLIQSRVVRQLALRLPDGLKRVIKSATHSRQRPDLSADEPRLTSIFKDDIGAVEKIIGRDLSHWLLDSGAP